jgi:hypothetical protein
MSAQVPQIVASMAFNDQIAPIEATDFYTPTEDGLYELHFYVSQRVENNSVYKGFITYTDDGGSQTGFLSNGNAATLRDGGGGVLPFKSVGTGTMTVSLTISPSSETAYDAYFTLVQL